MLKNKLKELLKNKKVLAVCAFVVVALGLAGATLALSSSATPVNEVSKANEVNNKQDNSKDNKDNKKEENNNSPVEDKEVDTHANEEGEAQTLAVANTGNTEDTNLNSSSSGTSTNTASTNSSSSVSNSNSSSNTNTGSSSSSNTSNASSSTVAPSEPSHDHTHDHVHNWVPITQQITHPEEGYWADELVSGAWTEEIPVYEERARDICNGCGLDITEDPWTHAEEQMLAGNYACGGYHTEYRQVQVGTNTVYHDAIYSKKWIVSSPAWVETVTTGYQCSDCGATK